MELVQPPALNVRLYAKCRTYLDLDDPEATSEAEAEVEVASVYDGNPTRQL